LASIEGSSLRAPAGERDDRADSYALACRARMVRPAYSLGYQDDYGVEVFGARKGCYG
jgi:hypothetical protein